MTSFDLIIVGGGSAGMSAAEFASAFDKKVALVSKNIGGECLYTGCVPSKALINAAQKGLSFTEAILQLKSAISTIEHSHDNADFFKKLGLEVFIGTAQFLDRHTIEVNGQKLSSKYFLIATGSRPFKIPLTGLDSVDFLTNENVFKLRSLPQSLTIIGGGPIGCELAQVFARFGSQVTIVQAGDRLLPKDEPEAGELLFKIFQKEGIKVILNAKTKKIGKTPSGIELMVNQQKIISEQLLLATGRIPNTAGLSLDKIGLKISQRGIEHNPNLQTNLSNIYLAGDVAGDYQFTHFAGVQAVAAVRNIFIPLKVSFSPKVIPWCTFTDPEIAHGGLLETEAKAKGLKFKVLDFSMSKVDRAVTEDSTEGFIKLIVDQSGRILGVTIAAKRAGEMIHELLLAMENDISATKILSMIHIYPTYSSAVQQILFEDLLRNGSTSLSLGKILSKLT